MRNILPVEVRWNDLIFLNYHGFNVVFSGVYKFSEVFLVMFYKGFVLD